MNDWPSEEIGQALLTKDVGPEEMGNLVKVLLLGGGDVEAANKKNGKNKPESDEEPAKSSQLDEFQQMASGEFVPPTFNPSIWAQAPKQNTRLSRCIRTYARNTVGLGWHIEPIHPVTEEMPDAEKKEIEWQTQALRELFSFPSEKMPFTELSYLMKVDEESTGNGYIEAVRNNGGKIVRLFHAPSTTMRRRIMKSPSGGTPEVYGYIQIRGNQKRYFKEFGDHRVMNAKSGEWHSGSKPLPPKERATEILHFLIYDPTSSYYGAPRYVPAATAVAGNRQAAIRNVSFFENDAVPRMAVLVSGGRLTQESMQQIEDFLRGKGKGSDQVHRVMILQVEPSKVGFQQTTKTMVELKPLTVGVTEDQSFGAYRKDNDEEVREIFGLHPIFFTGSDVNKASAATGREITNEQELEPDRIAKEYIINQTLVADVLCHAMAPDGDELTEEEHVELRKRIRVQFRFARLVLTDPLDSARMDQIYASLGALTPNELRERLDKPHYPKDYYFANKPLPVAMAELAAGLALAIALKEEQTPPTPEPPPGMAMPGGLPLPEGIEPLPPTPEEGAEPPSPQTEEPRGKQKNPRSKGVPALPPEKAYQIAVELMADARRLALMGASVGRGGSDGA